MSELEEKLENILGNPQAMSQIMALAQSLNQGSSAASAGEAAQTQPQEPVSAGAAPPASTSSSSGPGQKSQLPTTISTGLSGQAAARSSPSR